MTHAWWSPEHQEATKYPARRRQRDRRRKARPGSPLRSADAPRHSFSLIMPCREEEEIVMEATLLALLGQTHPRVEIILSVGHDDIDTVAIAYSLAERYEGVKVSVNYDPIGTKNKPKQMNDALLLCENEIVGVFDAESIAAADLLMSIDAAFQDTRSDVVQGAVQLINFRDTWFSLRNCLEYYFWFRSRLHAHAQRGFIPLGGNTVFIKTALLREVGGWDGNCLAEDCDLGVRLSTLGHKIAVAYAPDLVTREETPATVKQMIKQRTRWSLGFMQVLAKGDWKRLPRRGDRARAWWCLMQQHFMAFTGLAAPVAIVVAIFLRLPLPVVMLTWLPAIPTLAMIVFECIALRDFGRDHGFRIRAWDYARLIIGTPFYQLILATAAVRALIKFRRGDFRWEKTAHSGAHLEMAGTGDAP
jgi:cellulose synthase/poly-beta-1,6-N-acetylglucosamine synthase-like glycosyltransferase